MWRQVISCVSIPAFALWSGPAAAEVKPAPVFGPQMVLQRDTPAAVWGTAAPDEKVTVAFCEQEKSAVADARGNWSLKLDPLKAGGPDTLRISATNVVTLEDVLVGEVWLGSGQSNMVVGTAGTANNDPNVAELVARDHPQVRIGWAAKGDWRPAKAPVSLPALPFVFAVRLQEQLKVPVGVVIGAVPGSSVDFWLTEQAIRDDADCQTAIRAYAEAVYPRERKNYEERLAKWNAADETKRTAKKPEPPLAPGKALHEIGRYFEQHIRPVLPMTVRGVLWDQGENGPSVTGVRMSVVMNALIRDWRKQMARPDLPWIFVQKPSGGGCAWDPKSPFHQGAEPFAPLPESVPSPNDGLGREQFLNVLRIPGTAMAVTSDLSPGIHPPMKSSYGTRAAEAAMATVYGKNAEIYGPLFAGHEVDGARVRVRFTHVGKGLEFRHGDRLQGFLIAGDDRKFVWADAVIDGEQAVVSSPAVTRPAAVRYARAAKCPWANLFNRDGLPAQAIRTDNW